LILSSSEISDLYHFPFTQTTKTEDLIKSHSKELPAPISLKKVKNLDVVFANNHYGGGITQIGLTKEERRRHMYILGATGTGKTTLLLSMIKQDMENDKGLCVVDPHGDLIEDILHIIPKNRIKDVVYFNPDDIGYPVGINLLELSNGLSPEDAIREKELIAFFETNEQVNNGSITYDEKIFSADLITDQANGLGEVPMQHYENWINNIEDIAYLRYTKHWAAEQWEVLIQKILSIQHFSLMT